MFGLSTELITQKVNWPSKEIRELMFQGLALHQTFQSHKGLTSLLSWPQDNLGG